MHTQEETLNRKLTHRDECSIDLIFASTSTPTSSLAIPFHMYYYIHTPVLQELMRALTDIFWICRARSDDVNYTENAALLGCMAVIVVVVVVMVVMVMRV
jgi:hypothetical protein